MSHSQPHGEQTVSQAGEEAVLAAIAAEIADHNAARANLDLGLGDDAAVVSFGHARVVMTTDTMAEDQDFRRSWWSDAPGWATSVGIKAAAQNLSDINAMGSRTQALLVSLTLPPETPLAWVRDFYRGVIRACRAPGAEDCLIAGGDLASGEKISITITALGEAPDDGALLTRAGARPDDVVAVCGPLGLAAAGLALLERGGHGGDAEPGEGVRREAGQELIRRCLTAQQRPEPPLTAGGAALAAGATAGMDLSDGLLRDAQRLARASAVRIRLDDAELAAEAQSLHPVAEVLAAPAAHALDWVLAGGEDYSLLATFGPEAALPQGFRRIGTVTADASPRDGAAVITTHRTSGPGWDSVTG